MSTHNSSARYCAHVFTYSRHLQSVIITTLKCRFAQKIVCAFGGEIPHDKYVSAVRRSCLILLLVFSYNPLKMHIYIILSVWNECCNLCMHTPVSTNCVLIERKLYQYKKTQQYFSSLIETLLNLHFLSRHSQKCQRPLTPFCEGPIDLGQKKSTTSCF